MPRIDAEDGYRARRPPRGRLTRLMLKIDETSSPIGGLAPVFLRVVGGALEIVGSSAGGDVGVALTLPDGALAAVMARYGAPFDPDAPIAVVDSLSLGDGGVLRHV